MMTYGGMGGFVAVYAILWILVVGAVVVALWRGMQAQEKMARHLGVIERVLTERLPAHCKGAQLPSRRGISAGPSSDGSTWSVKGLGLKPWCRTRPAATLEAKLRVTDRLSAHCGFSCSDSAPCATGAARGGCPGQRAWLGAGKPPASGVRFSPPSG